jgi:hypothetical protein
MAIYQQAPGDPGYPWQGCVLGAVGGDTPGVVD